MIIYFFMKRCANFLHPYHKIEWNKYETIAIFMTKQMLSICFNSRKLYTTTKSIIFSTLMSFCIPVLSCRLYALIRSVQNELSHLKLSLKWIIFGVPRHSAKWHLENDADRVSHSWCHRYFAALYNIKLSMVSFSWMSQPKF
jgi:hypothetical protein